MTVSNDLIIEVALNVVGFLASGGLMIVAFSMFFRKNNTAVSASAEPEYVPVSSEEKETESEKITDKELGGKIEFVNFQNSKHATEQSQQRVDTGRRFHRNRIEVIKQAKEMLKAGKSTIDVRHALPIAEAELDLIRRQREGRSLQGAANDN